MESNRPNQHPGESLSVWLDTAPMPDFPQLLVNREVDVCIVGGGIAGLTTAYLLLREGRSVCVLEDFELGGGQTGRTTAHLVTALDDRYFKLEEYHGEEGARLAAQSHRAAIDRVEEIVREESIDCELERIDGYLFSPTEDETDILQREFSAAKRAGLTDIRLLARAPFHTFESGPAICFPQQAQIHPLRYLRGLALSILRMGGEIYTQTHVKAVRGGKDAAVTVQNGSVVKCKSAVVATNSPVNDLIAVHTKQAAYRTYVIGIEVPKGSLDKALYWDTRDPYHYLRLEVKMSGAYDVLIVGGEDHKTGQKQNPSECYARLEDWTHRHFARTGKVLYRWSGQVMEPVDGLAFLGHNPLDKQNVYIITGDSGNGMTHSTIGAMIITDQIMERPNPWEALYNPGRITLRSARNFLKENVNTLAQYADWLRVKEFQGFESVPPGHGAVFRDGVKMIAAYRTEDGKLELRSAACTHLGGVVHWNSAEKSWDCPCHGSRFDAHGKVLEGPAISNLKPITSSETRKLENGKLKKPPSKKRESEVRAPL